MNASESASDAASLVLEPAADPVPAGADDIQPRRIVDSRGQRHRVDGKGRFVRDEDGGRSPIKANGMTGKGRRLLPMADGRGAIYRRYKTIARQIAVDQGNIERISSTKASLIKRFAAASVLAEALEAKIVAGKDVSITEHAQLSSTLVRLAQRIGLGRTAKDVTPSLASYLAGLDEEAS